MQPAKEKKFKFDWEGGLSDLKEKFTSVGLQHKALEIRGILPEQTREEEIIKCNQKTTL